MKLIKLNHHRCDDRWAATTYVWVHDHMQVTELDEIIEKARDAYLTALDAYKLDPKAPPNVGFAPICRNYPQDWTLAQMAADHAAKKLLHDEWRKKQIAAKRPFADYLVEAGKGLIVKFYQFPPALSVDVRWGHRHGDVIEYSDVKPNEQDLNAARNANEEDNEEQL